MIFPHQQAEVSLYDKNNNHLENVYMQVKQNIKVKEEEEKNISFAKLNVNFSEFTFKGNWS